LRWSNDFYTGFSTNWTVHDPSGGQFSDIMIGLLGFKVSAGFQDDRVWNKQKRVYEKKRQKIKGGIR
jgi:hypothetical protein